MLNIVPNIVDNINKQIEKLTQEHNNLSRDCMMDINSVENHKENLNVASHYIEKAITGMQQDLKIVEQIGNLHKKRLKLYTE